jgi:Flp pilus assembly protein TadB
MTTTLFVMLAIVILVAVIGVMGAILGAERKKNKELDAQVKIKQKELETVIEYEEKAGDNRKERKEKEKEVENAESEKDILDSVNSVIADNNKLRNKSKK